MWHDHLWKALVLIAEMYTVIEYCVRLNISCILGVIMSQWLLHSSSFLFCKQQTNYCWKCETDRWGLRRQSCSLGPSVGSHQTFLSSEQCSGKTLELQQFLEQTLLTMSEATPSPLCAFLPGHVESELRLFYVSGYSNMFFWIVHEKLYVRGF